MSQIDPVIQDSSKIIATLGNLFKKDGVIPEFEVLSMGECIIEATGFDNWNGGITIYGIFCKVPLETYSKYELQIPSIEQNIKQKAEKLFRTYPECWIGDVVVSPVLSDEIQGKAYNVASAELLKHLELQKALLISVATGGPKIQTVNSEYRSHYDLISEGLSERNIKNTNPFNDLWEWHGKWSGGELPTWQSRRTYITSIFAPIIGAVKNTQAISVSPVFEEPTGWTRVDRSIGEIKLRIVQAATEEQFQAIGLLCRETLISVAQVVFIEDDHPTVDGIKASKTDAKRMLEAYLVYNLPGKSNENIRRHAKASLDLANDLTHRRTAEFRLAAICAEATNAVVNIIAIISGRRDPR